MGLIGPGKTIVVEPVKAPATPKETPTPAKEPVKDPVPA